MEVYFQTFSPCLIGRFLRFTAGLYRPLLIFLHFWVDNNSVAIQKFIEKEVIFIGPLLSLSQQAFYYSVQVPVSENTPKTAASLADPGQPEMTEQENGQKISDRRRFDTYECQTCKNRKYKDGSDDPGVSFKTPTRIRPENAAYAIRSHEGEHVSHARAKAQREDQKILSQSVTYHTAICPECGRTYMSGGTTRTVFQSEQNPYKEDAEQKGQYLDTIA